MKESVRFKIQHTYAGGAYRGRWVDGTGTVKTNEGGDYRYIFRDLEKAKKALDLHRRHAKKYGNGAVYRLVRETQTPLDV